MERRKPFRDRLARIANEICQQRFGPLFDTDVKSKKTQPQFFPSQWIAPYVPTSPAELKKRDWSNDRVYRRAGIGANLLAGENLAAELKRRKYSEAAIGKSSAAIYSGFAPGSDITLAQADDE